MNARRISAGALVMQDKIRLTLQARIDYIVCWRYGFNDVLPDNDVKGAAMDLPAGRTFFGESSNYNLLMARLTLVICSPTQVVANRVGIVSSGPKLELNSRTHYLASLRASKCFAQKNIKCAHN